MWKNELLHQMRNSAFSWKQKLFSGNRLPTFQSFVQIRFIDQNTEKPKVPTFSRTVASTASAQTIPFFFKEYFKMKVNIYNEILRLLFNK